LPTSLNHQTFWDLHFLYWVLIDIYMSLQLVFFDWYVTCLYFVDCNHGDLPDLLLFLQCLWNGCGHPLPLFL
jgi:hypothetical protein